MKRTILFVVALALSSWTFAGVDMQANVYSDEGRQAYTDYKARQSAYYTGDYTYKNLILLTNTELFGRLNTLMGNTARIGNSSFTYNTLRYQYINVDRDLNNANNIIGYYDGRSMKGAWDGGTTYNREHTWPQSKGADKGIPMGHDMHSVRPASTSVNGERGNDAYGESSGFYDPSDIAIDNADYNKKNNGTYRGDAARVILYDYLVYGQNGTYKNSLYNGNAQLLSKMGGSGVFESLAILLKWHMQDPPSLTEAVRNDGAQNYQGNRNPFIDYPELAISMFQNQSSITCYEVECKSVVEYKPAWKYTTPAGFVSFLTYGDGSHPSVDDLEITGATYTYDEDMGRLTVTKASQKVTIKVPDDPNPILDDAVRAMDFPEIVQYTQNNSICLNNLPANATISMYDCTGRLVELRTNCNTAEYFEVEHGIYIFNVAVDKKMQIIKSVY